MKTQHFANFVDVMVSPLSRRSALFRLVGVAGLAAATGSGVRQRVVAQDATPAVEKKEMTIMTSYAFVIPVVPGMAQQELEFAAELRGPRKAEYEASRARLGITREQAWRQETSAGTVTVVYLEAEDIERALAGLDSSQAPFDQWWREQIGAIHGIDPAQPSADPPNEPIIDFRRG